MTEPTADDIRRRLTELPDLAAPLPDMFITRTAHGEGSRPTPGPHPARDDGRVMLGDVKAMQRRGDWAKAHTLDTHS